MNGNLRQLEASALVAIRKAKQENRDRIYISDSGGTALTPFVPLCFKLKI